MYTLPREYVCPKGHTRMYSPDHMHPAPVFWGEERVTDRGHSYKPHEPICPVCFEEFIRANVDVMKPAEKVV